MGCQENVRLSGPIPKKRAGEMRYIIWVPKNDGYSIGNQLLYSSYTGGSTNLESISPIYC